MIVIQNIFIGKLDGEQEKNHIKRLKTDNGDWCSEQETMQGMAVEYFQNLFTSDTQVDPQELVDLIQATVPPR